MPELPEVEVVRAGLASALAGARVAAVEVRDPRALKRHLAGPVDFERRATGALLLAPARRGKFLWVPIAGRSAVAPIGAGQDPAEPSRREVGGAALTQPAPTTALLGHLGMSGQMLLRSNDAADDRHVRVRLWIEHREHGELRLDFADQRLFGSLAIDELVPTSDGRPAGLGSDLASIPGQAAHIARDPLDPAFDDDAMFAALRGRRTAVKRALLDQGLISGVGNIYADEALWRARLHPERPADSLSTRSARILLSAVRDVFAQALAEGGTSFDAQYVNVNGEAGYFAHSLNAYGRGGEACPRCGGPISREAFMNRSSHFCPRCQRRR